MKTKSVEEIIGLESFNIYCSFKRQLSYRMSGSVKNISKPA